MLKVFRTLWLNHARDNLWFYLLTVFCLVAGIITGTVSVKLLTAEEALELGDYLSSFFMELEGLGWDQLVVIKQSLYNNLKTMGLIWFLGLTVVGTPMILLLLYFEGFTLGFTAGFLVQSKGLEGILLALTALTPPNIFFLPGLITAGVIGITFSVWLVKGRHEYRRDGILQQFFAYSISIGILCILVVAAAFLEAYCSPLLMKLVIS
ncbi:MAG TPA: stage II sporulation protein M [Clostridia bacterium]|nr:stage II sporulation protein M [Clostridia bacterium]